MAENCATDEYDAKHGKYKDAVEQKKVEEKLPYKDLPNLPEQKKPFTIKGN